MTLMHLKRHGCLGLDDAVCVFSWCTQTTPWSEQQEVMFPSFSVLLRMFLPGLLGRRVCRQLTMTPHPPTPGRGGGGGGVHPCNASLISEISERHCSRNRT